MLTGLPGSATSDVASGSSQSLQDAQRMTRRPTGGPIRESNSNTIHETKTESSAIDPLSQVRSSSRNAWTDGDPVMCLRHSGYDLGADEDRARSSL